MDLLILGKTPSNTLFGPEVEGDRYDNRVRTRHARGLGWALLALASVLALLPAPANAQVEAGAGAAVGGGFYTEQDSAGFQFAASPLVAAKWDPFPTRLRPTFGIATMPTLSYSMGYDAFAVPLIVGELGLAYGSRTHRGAIFGHAGLFSFGAGLSYTWLPLSLGENVRHGPELRAVWMARKAGYIGLAWTFRFGNVGD